MHVYWKYFNRLLMIVGALLLTASLMGMAAARPQPVQGGLAFRRTPAPTRTPRPSPTPGFTATPKSTATPAYTPTPTSQPYATPTAGPTTVVSGTWKIVTSPNVGTGTYGNKLNGVAALSSSDVWAVGFSPATSGTPLYIRQSLIERWDGSSWSVVASPDPAGKTDVELNAVSAVSASDIWAVGHSGDPSTIPYQTLTEHWNGANWDIVSSPSPGTYSGNDLTGVAAISTNDVWAVGGYQSGPTGQEGGSLTMHWDGASWMVVSNPGKAALYAVTAFTSNDVWAVGGQVILHWDGASWSSVSYPALPNHAPVYFRGISGTSASDIWAAGYATYTYGDGYIYAPQTYHWDGGSWSSRLQCGDY